jgi:thiamine-phosphate pyrophosphorylase
MAEIKPHCRLYLQFPMQPPANLISGLAHVAANTDAACVLLCSDPSPSNENPGPLVEFVQGSGLACLIAEDAAFASKLGADGVHLAADSTRYTEARKILGPDASLGAGCGLSRHDAMQLAGMGADDVAFGPADRRAIDTIDQYADLISWWSEIFVVPCVAWNVASAEEAARCAACGADFVAPALSLWRRDDGPRLIAEIDRAVRGSRRAA